MVSKRTVRPSLIPEKCSSHRLRFAYKATLVEERLMPTEWPSIIIYNRYHLGKL